jgi:hypothetical protein
MSHKINIWFRISGSLLLAAGITLWAIIPTRAQCEDDFTKSACITCHQKETEVPIIGEWHDEHVTKDCCAKCHGGNCTAMDKDLAHESMMAQPLNDIYTNCYSCHPQDYQALAEHYAIVLGVTTDSRPPPTPLPARAVVEHPMVIQPISIPAAAHATFSPVIVIGSVVIAFLILIMMSLILRQHPAQ